MTTNDTHTARERAEEQAKVRYVDGRRGAIWDGLSTMVQTAKEGYIAGFLARDAETTTVTAEQVTSEIYKVTSNWDEPLDDVHDIPQITNALLARFRIQGGPA